MTTKEDGATQFKALDHLCQTIKTTVAAHFEFEGSDEQRIVRSLLWNEHGSLKLEIEFVNGAYDLWARQYRHRKFAERELLQEFKIATSKFVSVMVCAVGATLELGTTDLLNEINRIGAPVAPPVTYEMQYIEMSYGNLPTAVDMTRTFEVDPATEPVMISFGKAGEPKSAAVKLYADQIVFGRIGHAGQFIGEEGVGSPLPPKN